MQDGRTGNPRENNGVEQASNGGLITESSGPTLPSERSSPPTMATTFAQSRATNYTLPSGDIILQMLQGPGGTRHLERLSRLHSTITQIYDSIPRDSSTILPSIDSYIATLTFATVTEAIKSHATRDAAVDRPPAGPDLPEAGQASREPQGMASCPTSLATTEIP
jgi:hypothetical protein